MKEITMNGNGSCKRENGVNGSVSLSSSPCAACKLLRRRCSQNCVFAPYFPADEPHKFASVHKVFGASNVNKLLQELAVEQRTDAVSSMVYEANARIRDPVYGCVGAISSLQRQVDSLQQQLAIAQAQLLHLKMGQQIPSTSDSPAQAQDQAHAKSVLSQPNINIGAFSWSSS